MAKEESTENVFCGYDIEKNTVTLAELSEDITKMQSTKKFKDFVKALKEKVRDRQLCNFVNQE